MSFEESIIGIYPETTQVGWMTFDTIELMKSKYHLMANCNF